MTMVLQQRKRKKRSSYMFYTPATHYYKRILSIDQSTTRCGYAIYDSETAVVVAYGVEAFDGCRTLRSKYRRFVKTVQALLEKYKPDAIVIEGVRVFHGNAINIWAIIVLSGFYSLTIAISDADVYALDTNEWKGVMLGNSIANKKADIARVQELGFELVIDDNIADAILMALCTAEYDVEMRKIA